MKIFLAFLFLVCFSFHTLFARENGIILKIALDRSSYLEAQEVWVTVAAINIGRTSQYVQPQFLMESQEGIKFILKDNKDNVYSNTGVVIVELEPTAQPKTILSGDSISNSFCLTSFFSNGDYSSASPYLSSLHYLRAGRYSVVVQAYTGRDTITSNSQGFIVRKPVGENLKMLEQLRKVELAIKQRTKAETLMGYAQFIEDHGSSIYAPSAYKELISCHYYSPEKNGIQKAKEVAITFAKRFPNSNDAARELNLFARRMSNEEKHTIYKELHTLHPNTVIGRYCYTEMQKLEKNQGTDKR